MNNGDGNQTIAEESYDQAVENLAILHIIYLRKEWDDKLRDEGPLDLYENLHVAIDFDQLCEDVALRIKNLTKDKPDLIGPVV